MKASNLFVLLALGILNCDASLPFSAQEDPESNQSPSKLLKSSPNSKLISNSRDSNDKIPNLEDGKNNENIPQSKSSPEHHNISMNSPVKSSTAFLSQVSPRDVQGLCKALSQPPQPKRRIAPGEDTKPENRICHSSASMKSFQNSSTKLSHVKNNNSVVSELPCPPSYIFSGPKSNNKSKNNTNNENNRNYPSTPPTPIINRLSKPPYKEVQDSNECSSSPKKMKFQNQMDNAIEDENNGITGDDNNGDDYFILEQGDITVGDYVYATPEKKRNIKENDDSSSDEN